MRHPDITHPASPDDPPIYAELAHTYLDPQPAENENRPEVTE